MKNYRLLPVIVFALLAAACGGGSGGGNPPATPPVAYVYSIPANTNDGWADSRTKAKP